MLMLWILLALVLRVAYQSFLFKLLQRGVSREPPQTLQELRNLGYSLVMTDAVFEHMINISRIKNHSMPVILLNTSIETATAEFVTNSSAQLAGIAPMEFLIYYAKNTNQINNFFIVPEKIFTQHISIYFTKHTFLVERINMLLMNLRSQGLVKLWAYQSFGKDLITKSGASSESYERPITFEDVSGIFIIFGIMMALSCVAFVVELIWKKFKK